MKIQCDRCKEIYDKIEDTTITCNKIEMGENFEYHICSKCKKDVLKMINEYGNSQMIQPDAEGQVKIIKGNEKQ